MTANVTVSLSGCLFSHSFGYTEPNYQITMETGLNLVSARNRHKLHNYCLVAVTSSSLVTIIIRVEKIVIACFIFLIKIPRFLGKVKYFFNTEYLLKWPSNFPPELLPVKVLYIQRVVLRFLI